MGTSVRRAMTRLMPVLVLLAKSSIATPINNDACLRTEGQAGVDACTSLMQAIGEDVPRLNAHGRVLEELGRHDAALVMYRVAGTYAPRDKRALQGLIRARANARASRIILDLSPRADDVSPCWTERWLAALEACRREAKEHPRNARLQERLGDVARSVGDVALAQTAYSKSLALAPDNENLYRKQNALTALLSGRQPLVASKPAKTDAAPPHPSTAASDSRPSLATPVTSDGGNDPTIRRLELLEALKGRGLISAEEYEAQRSTLLADAFSVSAAAGLTAASTPRVANRYRGLSSGRHIAVVIGNDSYTAYPRLETAAADARAMSSVLRQRYGFEVTTLIDADRFAIMSALSDLRRTTTAQDSILLYYAGHGLFDEQADRGYWLPVDAERDNMAHWIATDDVAGIFAGAAAKHALVIADSCFAGTLLRNGTAAGFETLKRLAAKRSRTVLTSGGLEPVIDDGDGDNSVFAAALLAALHENDTVLEASKLFAAVRERVVLNADQTPQYSPMQKAGHDGGDFLFIPRTFLDEAGTQ